jgi:tetratricopeptide (TPR) repeat protein
VHPDTIFVESELGRVLVEAEKFEDATATLERVLAYRERSAPPDEDELRVSLFNLGLARHHTHREAEALELYQRALAIEERTLGPHHGDVADTLEHLGDVLRRLGRLREARAAEERALAIYAPILAANDVRIGCALKDLGEVFIAEANYREAKRMLERALPTYEQGWVARIAEPLTSLARAELGLGHAGAARVAAERAIAAREAAGATALQLAEARFVLAQALWGVGQSARAIALAKEARDGYAQSPLAVAKELGEIDQWMKSRS